MEQSAKNENSLFEVYLRLRPSASQATDRFLEVDDPAEDTHSHITIRPPSTDYRKRAVERFAFTKVFEENASQLDLFNGTHILPLVNGVLGAEGKHGRDGLLATLGVTGSGKSHTILGSRTQRGLLQMTLDLLFKSIGSRLLHPFNATPELVKSDVSEAQLHPAGIFLDAIYGDGQYSRDTSRAATPMTDYTNFSIFPMSPAPKRHMPQPAALPEFPSLEGIYALPDETMEYAIIVSMYEVYNDRIFDLLTCSAMSKNSIKELRRRPLLFKPTESSPDRKVVAGLKKVVCGTLDEALKVLETGLTERRVAGTGSNAVSSRSHGFFCVEVKMRRSGSRHPWSSSTLTIVDLAGSERARAANTTGSTLAEAGKINESLMYLGQCMQMQSDNATQSSNPSASIPFRQSFRQCKLTELLFANSFATHPAGSRTTINSQTSPQKAIMIVTADARGDFNATSQILRYSALAREVTVPRIPSVTSTILSGINNAPAIRPPSVRSNSRPGTANSAMHTPCPSGTWATSPNWATTASSVSDAEYDDELSQLSTQIDVLQLQLESERTRRLEAEANWAVAAQRVEEIETAVREECCSAFEAQMARERGRWREAWEAEQLRGEELLDAKMDVFARVVDVYEDADAQSETEDHALAVASGNGTRQDAKRVMELEQLVQELEMRLASAEREKVMRSPSRKVRSLKARPWAVSGEGVGIENESP